MVSYVSIDVETTGFSPVKNEIIQVGAWKVVDEAVVGELNMYVKPVQYIPREIQAITHITPDMVADAPSIEEVLPEIFEFCGDLPLLGHNLRFDYGFLLEKGRGIGIDFSLGCRRHGMCTLKLSRKFFPGFAKHTLEYMIEKLKIPSDGSRLHDASYDAYMTKLLYDRFLYSSETSIGSRMPELLVGDKKKGQYGKVEVNGTLPFD